ncbi:MAG: hydantoinase/oxoprolinase family protein [Methylophilaceae bacterium]
MRKQIGWDIGGAHLKAVLLNDGGQVTFAKQLPCALWLGLDRLETAIVMVLKSVGIAAEQSNHSVTMTGELADLFPNRHEGVVQISQLVTKLLGNDAVFYCMDNVITGDSFLARHEVLSNTSMVASANWHASATLLAKQIPNALLIDIGSTTTDIVAIENGKVIDRGLTDASRMQQDSLVYTGVVRTPVMAVAQKLMLDGKEANVAAEHFATMSDVYRITEELSPDVDMADTADKEAKTISASAKRLARMVGYDVENKPMKYWQQLAWDCREKQMTQIQSAVIKQMKADMRIVGAGAGEFLVKAIAHTLDRPYVELASLLKGDIRHNLAVCFPAYAVAKLALLREAK